MKAGWAAHTQHRLTSCHLSRPPAKVWGLNQQYQHPRIQASVIWRTSGYVLQMTGHLHLANHFAANMLVFLQSPGQRPMILLLGFRRLHCLSQHCPLLERLLKGGFRELVCSHHPRAYLCADVGSLPPSNKLINTSIIHWSGDVLKFNPTPWPFLLKSHLGTLPLLHSAWAILQGKDQLFLPPHDSLHKKTFFFFFTPTLAILRSLYIFKLINLIITQYSLQRKMYLSICWVYTYIHKIIFSMIYCEKEFMQVHLDSISFTQDCAQETKKQKRQYSLNWIAPN